MTDYVTTAQSADRSPERAAFDAWLPGAIERGWYKDAHVAWWAWQHQQREIDRLHIQVRNTGTCSANQSTFEYSEAVMSNQAPGVRRTALPSVS